MSQVNETRNHRLQQNVPSSGSVEVEIPVPMGVQPVICCFQCRHWDRRWPQANHAQCLQATKYASGGGVLLTTDLQTCSQAELRVR